MKDEKKDKQQQENESKRRDDIRNSEKVNEERVNHPGNDRVAKTNRSGMGQQQDSSSHPINS